MNYTDTECSHYRKIAIRLALVCLCVETSSIIFLLYCEQLLCPFGELVFWGSRKWIIAHLTFDQPLPQLAMDWESSSAHSHFFLESTLAHQRNTDILIDGPFIKELSDSAGEWRGSINQRIIRRPALQTPAYCTAGIKSGTTFSLNEHLTDLPGPVLTPNHICHIIAHID
jgi:hypothetical protein